MIRCGIYFIEHLATGRKYVGQSVDIDMRWLTHAKGNERWHIGAAIRKYGWPAFRADILEACDRESLNAAEVRWIDALGTLQPAGFNLTTGGGQGFTFSEEVRRKISERTRAGLTKEVCARRAEKLRGVSKSAEHKAKIGAAQRNPTNIARIVAMARNQSAETREKIAASHRGKKSMTEDGRRRLSDAKRSPENLARLAHMARNFSSETKAKMSASAKARCARVKALKLCEVVP